MPRRLLSAAAAGALLLGLTACGEGEEGPVTTAPPEIGINGPSDGGGDTDPSDGGGDQTEEPTADAPDIPRPDPADYAGMDENTPEGAEQAFRYYIAVSIWAHQTGDASPLNELQDADCGGCKYLNGDIEGAVQNDLLWTPVSVSDTSISNTDAENFDLEVRYKFIIGAHSRADEEFSDRIDVDELQYDSVGGMSWTSDQWLVTEMSVEWGNDVH